MENTVALKMMKMHSTWLQDVAHCAQQHKKNTALLGATKGNESNDQQQNSLSFFYWLSWGPHFCLEEWQTVLVTGQMF